MAPKKVQKKAAMKSAMKATAFGTLTLYSYIFVYINIYIYIYIYICTYFFPTCTSIVCQVKKDAVIVEAAKAGKASKVLVPGDVEIKSLHHTDAGIKHNKACFAALQERLSKTNLKKMAAAEGNAALTLEAKIKMVREAKDW
jgi:hypothetical protein